MKPLIGLPADSADNNGMPFHSIGDKYVRAVAEAADAIPLVIPALASAIDMDALLDRIDGLVLTGALSNVHPHRYGHEAHADYEPYDQARDDTTIPLIGKAIERGMPVFCICRGFQELNVFFGGSLRCDLGHEAAGSIPHHLPVHEETAFAQLFSLNHAVSIAPGGVLETVVGRRRVVVNSVHHQGVDRLGRGLRVEALADDGLVEAISWQEGGAAVLGVQWHPEWDLATDPVSQAIFDHFGRLLHGEGHGALASPALRRAGA